jgi:uncharacterized protein
MSESKGQHEPSMEEILASIRRIIAEDGDQTAPAAAPTAPPPPAAPPPAPAARHEEILELTEVVEPEPAAPEPPVAPEMPPPPAPVRDPDPLPIESGDRLVSDEAAAASMAALSQLNQLGGRSEQRMSDIPLGDGQRSIEDLVREMLRPLLKEWLDSNLPHLVERVVQEEVGRIVRDVQKR